MTQSDLPGVCVNDLVLLQTILWIHLGSLGIKSVFLFGSRVRGDHRIGSDLDVLIASPDCLPRERLAFVREALEESDLHFGVDILEQAKVNPQFLERIRAEWVEITIVPDSEKLP